VEKIIILVLLVVLMFSCTINENIGTTTTTITKDDSNDLTSDYIFNDAKHHKVEITIDTAIYSKVISDYKSWNNDPKYRLAESFTIDGVTVKNIGIKGRGQTTKDVDKISLKIAFDCTDPLGATNSIVTGLYDNKERKFCKVKKLNLRSTTNDPTLIREFMAYKIYREHNVPAPRSSTATVYVNGKSMGVYLVVEEITKRMVDRWFKDDTGNLYKCGWDNAGASFREGSYNSTRYSLQTNEELNNTSDIKSLMTELEKVNDKSSLSNLMDMNNQLPPAKQVV